MNHYRVHEGLLHGILARRLVPQKQLCINQIRTWKGLLTRPKSGLRKVEFAGVTTSSSDSPYSWFSQDSSNVMYIHIQKLFSRTKSLAHSCLQ